MIVLYWLLKRLGSKLAGQPISPRFLWELTVKENQPRPLGFLAVFKPVAARLLPLKETEELPRIKPIGFNSTNSGSSVKKTALKPHQKPIGNCWTPLFRFLYKGIHPASLGFFTVLNPEISQRFSLRETEESSEIKPIGFWLTIFQKPLKETAHKPTSFPKQQPCCAPYKEISHSSSGTRPYKGEASKPKIGKFNYDT